MRKTDRKVYRTVSGELRMGDFMPRELLKDTASGSNRKRNNGHRRRYFIEDMTIRDRSFKEIYEMHDRELESGLRDLEKFLNDKYGESYRFTLKIERLFER